MPDALSLPPLPVNAQFLGPEGRPPDVLSAVMLPQPLERHGVPGSQEDARQYKKAKDRDNLHDSESINGGNTASIIADVAMDLSRTESGLLNVQSQTETPTTGVVEGKLSYTTMAARHSPHMQKLGDPPSFPEDNIVVLDEDYVIDQSGKIPSIKFSTRVHEQIDNSMCNTIIVRLLGRSIGFQTLHS
ncbi:hypothetical protein V6N12_023695 [Hibiscus sabdariffa]|uniref:Uncharacterized protein n=1 Tax=Hibiscus sabdariffa TaxID=183260 RepID=A0ABR2FYF8_9ROSI